MSSCSCFCDGYWQNQKMKTSRCCNCLAAFYAWRWRRKSSKRGKARDWIKRRKEKGFVKYIEEQELNSKDTATYKEMPCMSHGSFLEILGMIYKDITPCQISGGSIIISSKARLVITLRFSATGETFPSLYFQFRVSRAAMQYHRQWSS